MIDLDARNRTFGKPCICTSAVTVLAPKVGPWRTHGQRNRACSSPKALSASGRTPDIGHRWWR